MKKIHLHSWLPFFVVALCLAADLLSKSWANRCLDHQGIKPFIPGIVHFHLTTNTGGAFGIGTNFNILISILASTILVFLIGWMYQRKKAGKPFRLMELIGLSLIIGGALGNITERLFLGHVTDFLEFSFFTFPVFNVADILIDVGVVLYLSVNLNNE
jgi:signal peptidase II